MHFKYRIIQKYQSVNLQLQNKWFQWCSSLTWLKLIRIARNNSNSHCFTSCASFMELQESQKNVNTNKLHMRIIIIIKIWFHHPYFLYFPPSIFLKKTLYLSLTASIWYCIRSICMLVYNYIYSGKIFHYRLQSNFSLQYHSVSFYFHQKIWSYVLFILFYEYIYQRMAMKIEFISLENFMHTYPAKVKFTKHSLAELFCMQNL